MTPARYARLRKTRDARLFALVEAQPRHKTRALLAFIRADERERAAFLLLLEAKRRGSRESGVGSR
jgi:hypothetical protein